MRSGRVAAQKKPKRLNLTQASNAFPPNKRTKLTYEDLVTIAPGNPRSSYVFRGNSVYDPDYTSTGHQPRYFDTYASVYEKYRVLASAIEVEVINGSAAAGMVFSVIPSTEVLTITTWPQAAEFPGAKVSEIVPIASRYPFAIQHRRQTRSVCGLMDREVEDEDWAAPVTTNPAQIWYWNLYFNAIDNTTNLALSLRVRLVYDVIFYDRTDPGVSKVQNPESQPKKPRDKPSIPYNLVTVYTEPTRTNSL
jgi:hypothetical protein